jgi:caffeoyl-CoA O-methyltransferase
LTTLTLPGIDDYAEQHTTADPPELSALVEETYATLPLPQMLSGPLVGHFLQMLVHAVRPKLVVEVGTYSGYSALSMAPALPPEGRIITCELDEAHAAVAEKHFAASPYSDRISLQLGPALDTLNALDGTIDFAFIDADKVSYLAYFQAILPKLSPHGLIACDNTLREGEILNLDTGDPGTRAMQKFNRVVLNTPGTECVLLPVRDGVTLIRRAG